MCGSYPVTKELIPEGECGLDSGGHATSGCDSLDRVRRNFWENDGQCERVLWNHPLM